MFRALPALLAAVLLLSACTGSDAVDQTGGGQFKFHGATKLGDLYPQGKRKAAANFEGTLLDGGSFSLASTKGKVVVLNFWGSWCGPCKTELPQFDLLYRKVKSRGVAFVGIDTKDPKDNARSFVRNNDISFPNVYDEPGEVAVRLGNLPAVSLPFTVVIDQQGDVAAVYVQRLSYADLNTAVTKLLAER